MKNILVTTDLTDLSLYAFSLAERIAKKTGSEIHLLHIINLPSHILLSNEGELLDDCEMDTTEVRTKRFEAIEKLDEIKHKSSLEVHIHSRYGSINERVVSSSKELNIDLIIMASHGVHNLKEKITGSHTEYVAMHAKAPVLSIKSDESGHDFKTILLAGSFQEDDIPNCELVIAIQQVFNSKIHLLRINTPKNFIPDHDAKLHMKAFANKHGIIDPSYCVYNDHSVEEGIIHYAEKESIDMIVIGSMQRIGLTKFIYGCVSASLVNHSNKPLLTFPLKN
jgi:nucleotide-binding universal stress UspA family protein